MPNSSHAAWPVMKRYDQKHLIRIAMTIGGIGTGTISLGGRGNLQDFEVVQRSAKHFTPANSFILHVQQAGRPHVTRALESELDPVLFDGAGNTGGYGSHIPNHNLPKFRHAQFLAAYPLGQVVLSDPDVPVGVRLEAFNPMIPGDADASGLPVAVLRYVLTNKTAKPMTATVCGNLENFIGADGSEGAAKENINEFRQSKKPAIAGVFMHTKGLDQHAQQFGTLALTTTATSGVSHRTAWAKYSWGSRLLDFWDDLTEDGKLDERESGGVDNPTASLAVSVKLAPKETKSVTFMISWHFPNRIAWSWQGLGGVVPLSIPGKPLPNFIGNYYCTKFTDAWDAAERTAAKLPQLEADTVKFVRAFAESDIAEPVKEAALFNASTLRTQTCFRTPDGKLYGWEGCSDKAGCCAGSCTHVWNYEQASAYLFGELALGMRDTEFAYATNERGLMSFRVALPLTKAQDWKVAAADGQMGSIMRFYRDWRLSGDEAFLRERWPHVKRSMEFCWIPGGWDGDRDGVMEGCQHNTMDVEYFGPNPEMGTWYLGALRACEEMARHLGDADFAGICRDLFQRGSAWMDANLFNGEYYEHEIRPIREEGKIAPGLRHESMGARNLDDPELQLGAGCLVDQLVGQYMAHVCGLGYLLDPGHIKTTLRSLMKHNFKSNLHDHFNFLRSYAMNDDAGLLVATYPRGRRPKQPFPYASEVWTGLEYTAASHMVYEGMTADGLKCIKAVRDRHDGHRRNPFDEPECGHHYARAMASWTAVLACTGFDYCGISKTMKFAAAKKKATWFWSNGRAWGTCEQQPAKKGTKITLTLLHGELTLKHFELSSGKKTEWESPKVFAKGRGVAFVV